MRTTHKGKCKALQQGQEGLSENQCKMAIFMGGLLFNCLEKRMFFSPMYVVTGGRIRGAFWSVTALRLHRFFNWVNTPKGKEGRRRMVVLKIFWLLLILEIGWKMWQLPWYLQETEGESKGSLERAFSFSDYRYLSHFLTSTSVLIKQFVLGEQKIQDLYLRYKNNRTDYCPTLYNVYHCQKGKCAKDYFPCAGLSVIRPK